MVRKSTAWAVLIYGLVLIALGVFAYMNAGSKISLYSGAGSGLLLIGSSILMFLKMRAGKILSLALTVLLSITFAIRYSVSHKEIPAILAVYSAGMLIFLLARSVEWKR